MDVPPEATAGPRTLAAKNPRDAWSKWSLYWLGWGIAFLVGEIPALVIEWRKQRAGTQDRVKRTLSANLRNVMATDSVTGIPLDVPGGKVRRFIGATVIMWFQRHIQREGEM